MNSIKRIFFYILIILFITSIYKDLSLGTDTKDDMAYEVPATINEEFSIVKIKVSSGDTVLSIVEEINNQAEQLVIQHVLADFKKLNPEVDPYNLQANTYYYFPNYQES